MRIVGQAPLAATIYKLEELRCNACGDGKLYLNYSKGVQKMGAGRAREYREGRQELARSTSVILACLGSGWASGVADDACPCSAMRQLRS